MKMGVVEKHVRLSHPPTEKEVEALRDAFREDGFVVVAGVLDEGEIADTLDELWNAPSLLGGAPGLDREDPTTWGNENWGLVAGTGDGVSKGFVDTRLDGMELEVAWNNRLSDKVAAPFEAVLETPELWVVESRFGVMRPTVGLPDPEGSGTIDRPEWRTCKSWAHVDQNFWLEPGFRGVQGILTLTDATPTSGGFCCVPGFHNEFDTWAEEHPAETVEGSNRHLVLIPEADPMLDRLVRVCAPAGSMIIWDSRLPHQNFPNADNTWRTVQYITYDRAPVGDAEAVETRTDVALRKVAGVAARRGVSLTDLFGDQTSFPGNLSPRALSLFGLLQYGEDETELAARLALWDDEHGVAARDASGMTARDLFDLAGAAEAEGDMAVATRLYQRAFRLDPGIDAAPRF